MHRPALDLPFGAGDEQAKLAINPMPATKKQVLFGARRLANVVAPMQQTHDPTTSAMSSFSARTRAARDPPLGAGHEQPKAGTGEKMGQSPPGGTFPAVLSSAPQTSGGARFKIPTLKTRRNKEGGMKDGASKSSKGKDRVGLRASEGSSRGMGGGQTTLEPRRSPQGRKEKGRGRGFRAEGKRPTVLHTQPQDDMDGFSRHALLLARQEAYFTYTAKLCQEKWDSFCAPLDFGPPPLSAESESSPKDSSTASEDQPNRVSSTLQGVPDHHHTAEDHGHPTWTEPPSGTRLEPGGDTTSGPLQDHPDQLNRVPSTLQGALPFPEPEATINTPPKRYGSLGQELAGGTESTTSVPSEASMEPPTQPVGDHTSTPTDNYNRGSPSRKGHIVDGSPLSPTTRYIAPTPQQAAPTTNGKAQPECRAQQAPHHYIKNGNEQAGTSSLQLGDGSTPAAVTPAAVRGTSQPASPISLTEPETPRMHRPARDLPFGAGHAQTKLTMDPLPAPPFPLTPAGEVIHPPPPALPPEAWPFEGNTNKAKHPKRDKVFLNTTHYCGAWPQSVSAQSKYVGVCLHECGRMCKRVRACA